MSAMRHPHETSLALYAGGETGWWTRLSISRHLRECENCQERTEAFRRMRAQFGELNELPADLDWDDLAAEMKANIRLGLEAGEIIGPAPSTVERLGWRPALVIASLVLMVMTGWWLYFPRPEAPGRSTTAVVLGATPEGIEMRQGNRALAIIHADAQNVSYSVDGRGAVGASYVDPKTGNVTISHVYDTE